MNNNDVIIYNTDRKGIDRCNCPQCRGCAGTSRVCFNSRKLAARALKNALTKTAGLFLLLGYFSLSGHATAAGTTDPTQNDKVSVGYLTVFSSTEETQWGEGSYYYVHTGYRIYDSTGQSVKWVDNHNTRIDEAPQKIELAPGTYTVWAQSEKDGYVKVPVAIKPARATVVRLESDRARSAGHL